MNPKIKSRQELKEIVENLKSQGKKVVTTNGAFDILHVSHINLLKEVKSLGDILVVLLNSDSSIKAYKGENRPILPQNERAEMLAALEYVDYVTIFEEPKPLKILEELKPNLHTKGYQSIPGKNKEEEELISKWNGKLQLVDSEGLHSTTDIIKKIIDSNMTGSHKECPKEMFNRSRLKIKPLSERESKSDLSVLIEPNSEPPKISEEQLNKIKKIASLLTESKNKNAPIVYAFGAHFIKNGLSKILIELMKKGYVQHLLSNEAVIIHDWELAFQGRTEEDVRKYIAEGQFGLWETGEHIGNAIQVGAKDNLGYGESIGKLILESQYPNKNISIVGKAYELRIPFSVGMTLGQNITHSHPKFNFEAAGKTSGIDFLKFVKTISNLEHGSYLSIGSAILSPQIFEKALSMARNVNPNLKNYNIFVTDIQPGNWDWNKGEPPKDNPAYYLRFMKTFARMGGNLEHMEIDNVNFLHNLYYLLLR